jgi:hypothetical protein
VHASETQSYGNPNDPDEHLLMNVLVMIMVTHTTPAVEDQAIAAEQAGNLNNTGWTTTQTTLLGNSYCKITSCFCLNTQSTLPHVARPTRTHWRGLRFHASK